MRLKRKLAYMALGGLFALMGLLLLNTVSRTSAQSDEGKLVFTIRKPMHNRDGFRAMTGALERGRGTAKWWEFYQYDICTMNPDGTDFHQLTHDGLSRRPRWSPDGLWSAYISGVDNAESLYVMKANGEEKRELIKNQFRIHEFWWSPRSHAILVALEFDRPTNPMENWSVTIDGESRKRRQMSKWAKGWFHWDVEGEEVKEPRNKLIEALPDNVSWPKWSPDRKYIAFVADGFLALADVEVTSVTGSWFLQQNEPPCQKIEEWSHDGKRILFYVADEICVATVDKGQFKAFVNLSLFKGRDATWNPDSSRIAFVGRDQGGRRTSEIYVMDAYSGDMKQITHTNSDHFDLHWR